MYPLKKILVGLDLSELDPTLIKFTSFIARVSQVNKIYFVNVVRNLNIPEDVLKEFPNLMDNAIKERKMKMKSLVDAHFDKDISPEISFVVKEGAKAKKILKWEVEKDIDLILVGRKTDLKGTGSLTQRLARRASCSLLIVPEGTEPSFKKLLVPSDFSDYSIIAMEQAIDIATRNGPEVEILCQNVYTVPAGYHYTGKSFEEFKEIMKKNAHNDYKKFIKKIDRRAVKIKTVYTLDENDEPVEDIHKMGMKIKADCIVIGAKGRTATTALFLGSMAELLIQITTQFPLLVVRPKGQNAGILDYILDI